MAEEVTRQEWRELMEETIVPIFPRQTLRAHLLALRLYLKWGVISFLCGTKKSIFTALDPTCRFLQTDSHDGRLMSEELADFAESYGDCLFLLVCLTEEDRALVAAHISHLESRMILTDSRSLFRNAPFDRFK